MEPAGMPEASSVISVSPASSCYDSNQQICSQQLAKYIYIPETFMIEILDPKICREPHYFHVWLKFERQAVHKISPCFSLASTGEN